VSFLPDDLTVEQIESAYANARKRLLDECVQIDDQPAHWYGELSTSALSTATAVMALVIVRQQGSSARQLGCDADSDALIQGGLEWLAAHQNDDGGWGDTVKSKSNTSTTMLAHAVFHASGTIEHFSEVASRAKTHIDEIGGIAAVRARYGKDKTFSVPILTHCALAGLVDWKEVSSLPFEMACLPAQFYKAVRLPVVSYALPALIAIGQVRFHFKPTWNPITWVARKLSIKRSLQVLERIQPSNGGFLEAAPLTSFVTMSLAGKGLVDHPVVKKGVAFLCDSAQPDGSWPIDTNLATWTSTLAVNALGSFDSEKQNSVKTWLLNQQYTELHPFTNADPGGWSWTDLPGGVPDADDTPGAILALLNLAADLSPGSESVQQIAQAAENGVQWLLGLQNRDGGFPTFCRGWGTLPFDRSSADITAHCLRALHRWVELRGVEKPVTTLDRVKRAIEKGWAYLDRRQRTDGSWLPLWFGNQHATDDENPTYGTSRVLMGFRDLDLLDDPRSQKAAAWLASIQNPDGGWGGDVGIESSIEETALASEVLLSFQQFRKNAFDGIQWLISATNAGSLFETCPIGFYFAKLWYFERLYPIIFATSALRHAVEVLGENRNENIA
jgi:squalene-hopene/tetraprenyl-beta-curcumene cyclase